LLLGERQKLRGEFSQRIAVKCDNIRDPEAV